MTDFNLLLAILKGELTDEKADLEITPESAEGVLRLAKKHDLTYVVAHYLNKNSRKTEKTEQAEVLQFYRIEQQKFTLSQVKEIFNKERIPFIPLKGSVIREYYNNPLSRSSCDIDILIKPEDLDRAEKRLSDLGYKKEVENFHDVSFITKSNVNVELHFSLLEQETGIDKILQNPWNYAVLKEKSEYKFTDEFFIFYFYAHAFHHFLTGGCGIKTLMDLYVLENNMGLKTEVAEVLLKEAEIYKFAVCLRDLSDCWFKAQEKTERTQMLEQYILKGGVYGNKENFVKVYNSRMKNSPKHLIGVLFPPAAKIKNRYKTKGILTYFYYPVYWLDGFKRHSLKTTQKTENYNVDNLLNDLGIIKKP